MSEAIHADPLNTLLYEPRGNAYSSKGDYDRAIADYGEVLRLEASNDLAHPYRGAVWAAKGEYDFAIANYDEAIRRNPSAAAAFMRARRAVYSEKEHYGRAIGDFDEFESREIRKSRTPIGPRMSQRRLRWLRKGDCGLKPRQ